MKKLFFKSFIGLSFLLSLSSYAKSESIYLYPFEIPKLHKYGYINNSGQIIIQPQYDWADKLNQGIMIYRKNNLYGFINSQGEVIEPIFTKIRGMSENKVCARKGNRWSFFDFKGKQIINKTFSDAYLFSNGFARVFDNRKYGYINAQGSYLTKPNFDYADNFSDNYAYATYENRNNTFINNQGKFVISVEKDHIYNFYENIAVFAGENNRYGYVNKQRKQVAKAIFQYADRFENGLARIKIQNKWGFIDKNGNYAIKPIFDELRNFSENLAAFKLNGLWGFIDKKGKIVINPKYFYVNDFSDNLATINVNNLWGFIDKKGQVIINPIFENAQSFSNGLALVNKYSYINKKAQYVWSLSDFSEKNNIESNIDENKYTLKIGQNVCVNKWGNYGFCGTILNDLDEKYRIKISQINCGSINCLGGCSDNIVEVSTNINTIQSLVERGYFTVEINKDCIDSYK